MVRTLPVAFAALVVAAGAQAGELGTNLDAVVDYSPQYVFVDAFKQSREWITQTESTFDTGHAGSLDLDADGWVRSLPAGGPYDRVTSLLFFDGEQARYPAGTYVVTYEGSGVLEYRFDAVKDEGRSAPGRDVLTVTPQVGFAVVIRSTTAGNHLRNIRVWMPGFDERSGPGQVFHPDFLRLLQPYTVLRFMDWMMTNSSTQRDFGDRPLPSHARYTLDGRGVPLEVMVDLANRTGKDPWFNMPHQASDDYVSRFAAQVRSSLNAGRRVYVEYSNEVWNGQFPQADYVEGQGQAAFGGGDSGFTKRMNWHGQRTAQVCDAWQAAFGGDAGRVVCVLGSQASNAFTATEAMDCPLSPLTPCHAHNVDAVAIAPYFGGYMGDPSHAGTVAGFDANRLFQEITSGGAVAGGPPGGSIAETAGWIAEHRAESRARGKALVAYEGGQHLVGYAGAENDGALTALFTSANRDPRMGSAYASYLGQWQQLGGELFVHFTSCSSYSKFGSWGAVERLDETGTPKQGALVGYAGSR
jgi:hypothetical protein